MSSVEFRKDLFADERDDSLNEVGQPTRRQDILGHVTGRSPFFDDHLFDGLLHLRCARSPHHHARIRSIDVSAAERMPGVVRVILPRDVPRNLNTLLSLIGFGKDDEAVLSEKKVAYVGEPVAAVIAETERQARAAAAAIRVDYEVLPHVLDVEAALAPGAPVVNEAYPTNAFEYHEKYDHQKLRFGDVEAAFAQADHVVEGRYSMSPIEQAPTETGGAIAAPETNDRYVCYTSTQALFFSLGTTAKLLDMSSSRLHFVGGTVGGGFGGKVDTLQEPLAVLGAMLTGRPVKYAFDRAEEMQVGAPRGGELWVLKDGLTRDGQVIARSFKGYFDAGAYTRLSSYAVQKAVGHLPGPYTIPNVSADVYCVYTNRTPSTAMRGFGITGVDFAIECHMDKGAEAVGMHPVEFRILNAYRDGDMKAHRREAKNCALIECCQVAAEKARWPISAQYAGMSSLRDGGGDRARIPQTVTDEAGRIGDRRSGAPHRPTPAQPVPPRPITPQPMTPQPMTPPPIAPQPAAAAPSYNAPPPYNPPPSYGASTTPPPAAPRPSYQPTTAQPAPYQPASSYRAPEPYRHASGAGSSSAPPASTPTSSDATPPEKRFDRGVNRPGAARFSSVSGTRRR